MRKRIGSFEALCDVMHALHDSFILQLLFGDKIKMARKPMKKQKENTMLFDNKIKMARKPMKKQKENLVGCNGESKR